MSVSSDGVEHGQVEDLFFGAGNRQRAVLVAWKLSAIDIFPRHRCLPYRMVWRSIVFLEGGCKWNLGNASGKGRAWIVCKDSLSRVPAIQIAEKFGSTALLAVRC